MRSRVIAQIHDNAILDCDPDETKEVKDLCTEIATIRLREEFPWIIVPLIIEWESTEIDGSWYAKSEILEED
jgi:DNA polymerase I-like protein with 3'-5' exonuclease and polymerase domains